MFLEGERVELRPLGTDDATFLQHIVNAPAVRSRIGSFEPYTFDEEVDWVESRADTDEVHLLVTVDDERVGIIGLHPIHLAWGVVEVGYFIDPEHWGNGYATDALRCMCRYAFEECRYNKVAAQVYETNPASRRVLEKVGFEEEGRFSDEAFIEGEYVDVFRFGLLADDWFDR